MQRRSVTSGLLASGLAVASGHSRDLRAARGGAGALHGGRLPARRAGRVRLLGPLARPPHRVPQRGGVQLLPHPSDRRVHDRRRRELGRARLSSSWRPWRSARWRSWPARVPRRPSGAVARRICPPRWPACCSAGRAPSDALRSRRPARSPRPTGCPRCRSSWRGSAETTAAARCRCWWTASARARCWSRRTPARTPSSGIQDRVVPALEALIGAARKREELEAQVIETKALRRSNVVKTTLLRSVSHDLRSPLTAITTAAGRAGVGHPHRCRAPRAGSVIARRERPALAARRQPARPLATAERRGRAPQRLVLGRRAGGGARPNRSTPRRVDSTCRSTPTCP